MMNPGKNADDRWMDWIKQLQSIAQIGLTYTRDEYDRERYEQLRQIIKEMLVCESDVDPVRIQNFLANEKGYLTPKTDVRGIVLKNENILLVQERHDGLWTLPGGWADVTLSASENVVKEIEEESGLKTKAVRLLAVYDRRKHGHHPPWPVDVYKYFFLCELIGGELQTTLETTDAGFFPLDDLPPLSLARVTEKQILRLMALVQNPEAPTDFD